MLHNGKIIKHETIKDLESKEECVNFLEGLKDAAKLGNMLNPKRGNVTIEGKCEEVK
jgi:hypothetical protein